MKITLSEVRQAFDDLINERKSREDIESWANSIQLAEDKNDLLYDPPDEENRIWDGIEYLMGVALLNMDGSYLHVKKDFVQYRDEGGFRLPYGEIKSEDASDDLTTTKPKTDNQKTHYFFDSNGKFIKKIP